MCVSMYLCIYMWVSQHFQRTVPYVPPLSLPTGLVGSHDWCPVAPSKRFFVPSCCNEQ